MGKPRLRPEQRGPLGAWAYETRTGLGWTTEDAVARLAAGQGVKMLPSTLRTLEAGHYHPAAPVLSALEAVYGSPAPQVAMETPTSELAALRASVDELRDAIGDQQAILEGMHKSLVVLAEALRPAIPPERSRR